MIKINGKDLTIEQLIDITRNYKEVSIDATVLPAVKKARELVIGYVENKRVSYGITTGFGLFSDVVISGDDTKLLQKNLIMSHACGVGKHFSEDIARAICVLRANALLKGNSGVRVETIEKILELLNKKVTPAIPEKGSLGASGDLAPLSHMVLTVLGMGEAYYGGKLMSSSDACKKAGIKPLNHLEAKEGLGLINGTQALTGTGALATYDAMNLVKLQDVANAMSMEALNGIVDAFDDRVCDVRQHNGMYATSHNVRAILEGSKSVTKQGEIRTQDPYSIRCVPQIHGASKDSIEYVRSKVMIEMNSVTDNPLIFVDDDYVISAGNFHGQPLALPFDFLGIAAAEVANVSERRIERLVNPDLSFGLPAFLVEKGGLNSGFMIVQYSAASLVSENKVLAHPASVDSITSSGNQEDLVSMGTIAARKARDIIDNSTKVIAMEMLTAAQAIDLRGVAEKLGKGTKVAYQEIRKIVDRYKIDRIMYPDIDAVEGLIKDPKFLNAIEKVTGTLRTI